jgi:hypothetical protein
VRLRSSTGSGRNAALAWQVDVRADGGYIVAPGTRTARGVYRPEGAARTPAPLPDWLKAELVRTGHLSVPRARAAAPAPAPVSKPSAPARGGAGRAARGGAGRADTVLSPLVVQVAGCAAAREGTGFTEKLNRAAYTAGGLVAAGHLDHGPVRDRLVRVANHARPWQQARNEKIIDDALAAGSGRPLHLKGRP